MPNIYLSIFKHVVEASGLYDLACQLFSGSPFFDYKVPGDAVTKTSTNNLTTWYDDAGQPIITTTNTISWISQDGTKGISKTSSFLGEMPIALTEPEITNYKIRKFNHWSLNVIQGGKSYLARSKDYKTLPLETTDPIGGHHVKTIGTTDHVIGYRMSSGSGYIRIYRNSTVYDENIDQSTIAEFDILAADYYGQYNDQDIQVPDSIENGTVSTGSFAAHNLNMVVNSDGTKLIFFVAMKDAEGLFYNQWMILEAADNGSSLAITQHSIHYENPAPAASSDVTNFIGGEDLITAMVSGVCTCSGSGDGTMTIDISDQSVKNVFLGVAYSRYDDSVIVLSRKEIAGGIDSESHQYEFISNGTGCNSSQGCPVYTQDKTYTYSLNEDNSTLGYTALCINGVPFIETVNYMHQTAVTTLHKTESATGSVQTDTTIDFKESELTKYRVIDLSSLLFAYEMRVKTLNSPYSESYSSDLGTHKFRELGNEITKTVIYANGTETIVKENNTQIDQILGIGCRMLSGPATYTGDWPAPGGGVDFSYTRSEIYDEWLPG